MKKTLLAITAAGILGAFVFSGPTRKADCSIYRGTESGDPEHQFVVFDNGLYERGPGFNPDELESGKAYRAKLKTYYSGLGEEMAIDATECAMDSPERPNELRIIQASQ